MRLLFLLIILSVTTAFAGPSRAPMCLESAGTPRVERCARFDKRRLELGDRILTVEIAKTDEEITQGLGGRTHLGDDQGMLFIYKDLDYRNFWMRNAYMHLSIGFFDSQKKLVDIQDMEADNPRIQRRLPVYASRKPAQYALEVPLGWFEKNGILLGSVFNLFPD